MDLALRDQLQGVGSAVPARMDRVFTVAIEVDEQMRGVPVGDEIAVLRGADSVRAVLRKTSELWTGAAAPPDFARGPTPAYVDFFACIELTAADYCMSTRTRVRDREFEQVYDHLRRRPDGTHAHPLYSYLQAAARLHMSLHDTSRAEFEAVVRRLAKSARTFSDGVTSSNYLELALWPLVEQSRVR